MKKYYDADLMEDINDTIMDFDTSSLGKNVDIDALNDKLDRRKYNSRPKKENPRSETISIRITKNELKYLEHLVDKSKLEKSEFIRRCLGLTKLKVNRFLENGE